MTVSNTTSPGKIEDEQSSADVITGFVILSLLWLLVISAALVVVVGTFSRPGTVGLFITLPYFTYTLVLRRDELKDGSPWHHFSKHNFVLNQFRKYLRLSIQKPIPPELLSLDR